LLIARAPRASSIRLGKAFPVPGTVAGLRLALFERAGWREVDICCFLFAIRPLRFWLVRRRYPLSLGLASGISGNAAYPDLNRRRLAIVKFSPADPVHQCPANHP
jgi:hypothetical protein